MTACQGPFAVAACQLAACGLRVVPIKPGTKEYQAGSGPGSATCDLGALVVLAESHADWNIAIAPGDGVVALDVDTHGDDGFATLATLEQELGALPDTATHSTPGGTGGERRLFTVPRSAELRRIRLGPGVEILANGSGAVAPPSVHPDGGTYAWLPGREPWNKDAADLPDKWLADALSRQTRQPGSGATEPMEPAQLPPGVIATPYGAAAIASEAKRVRYAPAGTANDALHRAGCRMGQLVAGGEIDQGEVERVLLAAATFRGVPRRERTATLASGLRKGLVEPRKATATRSGTARAFVPAAARGVLDRLHGIQAPRLSVTDPRGTVRLAGPGGIVATLDLEPLAAVDAGILNRLNRAMASLGGVVADRLLRWLVVRGFEQVRDKIADPRCITIVGGWSELARLIGANGHRAAELVRDLVHAFAHLDFRWSRDRQGNLLVYDEPVSTAPGQRRILRLILGSAILPGFPAGIVPGAESGWTSRDKRLVPMLAAQPPLDLLPKRLQPHGLRLSWLVMFAFADNAAAVAERGGLHWGKRDWQALGAAAHLNPDWLLKLVARWHDDSNGPAFLAMPEPGTLALGPAHEAASRFIAQRHASAMAYRKAAAAERRRSR